ncbi:hypothetical protein [Halocatena marina]|uniref:hypothetical protein n=1 Tax=Halocatena marina TaxID=2934937 RepID=UPI00200F29E3|nr:hypothetical protein [Halocatena marina]
MRGRTKASLLWGVIAALSFLVLIQAYHLFGEERVTLSVMIGVAVVVGVVSGVFTYVVEGWLASRAQQ